MSFNKGIHKIILAGILIMSLTGICSAQTDWVGQFLNRYKPLNVIVPAGANPAGADEPWRLMVQQGTLPIALSDVVRLMLASSLDVAVNRFNPIAQQYIVNINLLPFEPTLNIGARGVRSTTPVASQLSGTGASSLSQLNHYYSIGYGQTLQTGTQLSATLNVSRYSSNSIFNTFNPYYSGTATYSVQQPILQNFGRDINGHLIRIAKNNQKMSDIGFEMQTIDLVTSAEQMYWDLVLQLQTIKVRKESLALAEKTVADNQRQVQIGTMARIEVVQAESEAALREVQLVTASSIADQTQDQVKRLITSRGDPALVAAEINPIEPPLKPKDDDIMPIGDAIKAALESRPELRQLDLQLRNGDIDVQFTKNQLLPNLTVGASYTQNGVGGVQTNRAALGGAVTSVINGGLGDAFGQLFGYNYTGYAVGFNLSIPLTNRGALADNARAVTQRDLLQSQRVRMAQQIALEVRNAQTAVVMGKATIAAADKALQLANMRLEAEQKKFQLGISQLRFVLDEQRNVADAETTEVQALVGYSKALVAYDRAVGRTLRKNNIQIDKIAKMETSPSSLVGGR